MRMMVSFTGRGVRYPAPDVARGFMLLLVAVANVPVWNKALAGIDGTSRASAVDAWWLFVRALIVDHRAYPLFAMLFGFGLMTMINRRIASGTQAYLKSLAGVEAGLVRRRGWWMILFGFVHGIFFPGDIIGAYGLVAVIFAGWLARKRYSRLYVVGAVIMLIAACSFLAMGFASPETMEWSGAQGNQAAMALPWFVTNIVGWTVGLFVQVLVALIVPAAVIGARLADTDIVTQPDRHRRLLISTGIGGLALGALAALHSALANVLLGTLWPWDFAVKELFGIVGACGWLALLALYAGGPTPDGRLTGLRKLASAVGRRSMTAYLSQTFLFAAVFLALPALGGIELHLGEARAAGIALAVWLTTVSLCAALERGGHAGPFETVLRTAVARSERRRRLPAPPTPVAAPADPVVPASAYELVR